MNRAGKHKKYEEKQRFSQIGLQDGKELFKYSCWIKATQEKTVRL